MMKIAAADIGYDYGVALLSDQELIVFKVWMGTVIFTSLSGDSIILLATIKYRAIKQHKVVIAVMQHMAVCDLLQTVF